MKTAQSTALTDVSVDLDTIPGHEYDALCRTLIGSVSRLFDNPAVLSDYKRWQQKRQQEKEQKHE
ncbi:MAG: hypothetical protein ACI4TW_07350 [Prevotella sp.]